MPLASPDGTLQLIAEIRAYEEQFGMDMNRFDETTNDDAPLTSEAQRFKELIKRYRTVTGSAPIREYLE